MNSLAKSLIIPATILLTSCTPKIYETKIQNKQEMFKPIVDMGFEEEDSIIYLDYKPVIIKYNKDSLN